METVWNIRKKVFLKQRRADAAGVLPEKTAIICAAGRSVCGWNFQTVPGLWMTVCGMCFAGPMSGYDGNICFWFAKDSCDIIEIGGFGVLLWLRMKYSEGFNGTGIDTKWMLK